MDKVLLRSKRVQLFHGTTKSAADRIAREGWQPSDPAHLVDQTTAAHDESREAVWGDLQHRSRFVTHPGRKAWVSFATSSDRAARWAQRAPEAKWETLWAIWRLRNPEHADNWTTNKDGGIWVFEQMIDDPLVVITADIPVTELYEGGFDSWREAPLSQGKLDLLADLPDVRVKCPAPSAWITSIKIIARTPPAETGGVSD